MNLLTNYPDELVVLTAELLSKPKANSKFPYCSEIVHCSSCSCFNADKDRVSNCLIASWCRANGVHLLSDNEIDWESFADAFLNTFTLQKYPHFYV